MTPRPARALTSLLLLFVAAACADARDPVSLVTTSQTAPALDLESALPTLSALVARVLAPGAPAVPAVAADGLLDALAVWTDAPGTGDDAAVEAERGRARHMAAPLLAELIDPAQVSEMGRRMRLWAAIGMSLPTEVDPSLTQAVRVARVALDQADESRADGDVVGAMEATMAAADVLQETTPHAVAERLVHNARASLTSTMASEAQGAAGADSTTLGRAERLLRGAEEALAGGRYTLAIQRAYYAGQLLR